MSTESETKSAGVPAGATHRCAVEGCGIYYRQIAPFHYVTVPRRGRACTHFLRPIAEAGPAPTTAAPAEQGAPRERIRTAVLGTPDACEAAKRLADECVAEGHTETRRACSDCIASALYLLDEAHAQDRAAPAEQPGKAADPRPGEVLCDKPSYKHGGSHPKKVTCVDPRPAQPQAPAEPTPEQVEKARVWMATQAGSWTGSWERIVARYAEHVAAPLREERDRLACELEAMRRERNGAQSQRDQERARAEQAEARLSAAPSEAPRHCRICEEPMSDTCEECQ